eukprot:SAG25_NODE_962_length_4542_cov_45.139545_2_plen_83_part_00
MHFGLEPAEFRSVWLLATQSGIDQQIDSLHSADFSGIRYPAGQPIGHFVFHCEETGLLDLQYLLDLVHVLRVGGAHGRRAHA